MFPSRCSPRSPSRRGIVGVFHIRLSVGQALAEPTPDLPAHHRPEIENTFESLDGIDSDINFANPSSHEYLPLSTQILTAAGGSFPSITHRNHGRRPRYPADAQVHPQPAARQKADGRVSIPRHQTKMDITSASKRKEGMRNKSWERSRRYALHGLENIFFIFQYLT